MVGGKSEFSITPFLSKTVNLDGSPKAAANDGTPTAPPQFRGASEDPVTTTATEPTAPEPPSSAAKPTSTTKLVEKRPRGRPRTKPLSDSSPSNKNLTARNRKAPRVESTLENVAEEPDEGEAEAEGESSTNLDQENRAAAAAAAAVIPEKPEPKKKKRKLLGANQPTLFEEGEDEGERVKPIAAAAADAVPAAAAAVKRPAKAAGGTKKPPVAGRFGAGVKNAFAGASFSPLKRDRRGVAASFLA
jgi:hypothetical protein